MSTDFVVKDSGDRQQFESGMVRDVTEGKIDYTLVLDGPMFKRWLMQLVRGAVKYTARNWMKASGEPELQRFRESAFRHFMQWMEGERDEDHAAAVFFNINGYEYVRERLAQEAPAPGPGRDGDADQADTGEVRPDGRDVYDLMEADLRALRDLWLTSKAGSAPHRPLSQDGPGEGAPLLDVQSGAPVVQGQPEAVLPGGDVRRRHIDGSLCRTRGHFHHEHGWVADRQDRWQPQACTCIAVPGDGKNCPYHPWVM